MSGTLASPRARQAQVLLQAERAKRESVLAALEREHQRQHRCDAALEQTRAELADARNLGWAEAAAQASNASKAPLFLSSGFTPPDPLIERLSEREAATHPETPTPGLAPARASASSSADFFTPRSPDDIRATAPERTADVDATDDSEETVTANIMPRAGLCLSRCFSSAGNQFSQLPSTTTIQSFTAVCTTPSMADQLPSESPSESVVDSAAETNAQPRLVPPPYTHDERHHPGASPSQTKGTEEADVVALNVQAATIEAEIRKLEADEADKVRHLERQLVQEEQAWQDFIAATPPRGEALHQSSPPPEGTPPNIREDTVLVVHPQSQARDLLVVDDEIALASDVRTEAMPAETPIRSLGNSSIPSLSSDLPIDDWQNAELPTYYTNVSGTVELSSKQRAAYREVLKRLAEMDGQSERSPSDLDLGLRRLRGYSIMRWLAACAWNPAEAATRICDNAHWRHEFFPLSSEKLARAVPTGVNRDQLVRQMGHAKDGSSILLISARHFPPPTQGVDGTIEAVTALLMDEVENCLSNCGGLESPTARLTVVYDRTRSPSMWQEVDYGKAIAGLMQTNYPETLARAFLYPTSGGFRLGWKMARVFIDEDTSSKLILCAGGSQQLEAALATHIDPAVLSASHLGTVGSFLQ